MDHKIAASVEGHCGRGRILDAILEALAKSGKDLMGATAKAKVENLLRNLQEDRIAACQCVAEKL